MPALLYAISRRPNSATVRSTAAFARASSETSHSMPMTSCPAALQHFDGARELPGVAVDERHYGTGLRDTFRTGESHTGTGACHERHLTFEVVHGVHSLSPQSVA
jgi:hypothetical protein